MHRHKGSKELKEMFVGVRRTRNCCSRSHLARGKSRLNRDLIANGLALIWVITLAGCRGETEPQRPMPAADLQTTSCDFDPPTPEESSRHYSKTYRFSTDWFTPNVPVWMSNLGHFKGKPDIHYLEVGLFEGRSAIWMIENILTHPTSRLTGIDVFPENLEARWLDNLNQSGQEGRATTIKGYSQAEMRKLPLDSFDIIYIDGSHKGPDVLADAVLAWDLLKTGGILIFDDYNWRRGMEEPPELRPGEAIDAFITMNRDSLEVLHRCYQLVVEKRDNPCAGIEHCSPLGNGLYDWRAKTMTWQSFDSNPRQLSPRQSDLLEAVLRSRQFGRTEFEASSELLADPFFVSLVNELKLPFLLPAPQELRALRERLGPKRYSQTDEETFIRDFFKDRRGGIFVDVGASHYRVNSTTYFLDRHLGWRGLAIDALAKFAPQYAEHRPNTQFFSFYVADKSDVEQDFMVVRSNDRLSSGVDPQAGLRDHDTIKVPTIRLDDLLAREGIDGMDFLSMDIEMAEPQALAGFSIEKYRPALVCIEVHPPVRDQIEQYFAEHGYEKIELYSRLDPLNYYYRPERK